MVLDGGDPDQRTTPGSQTAENRGSTQGTNSSNSSSYQRTNHCKNNPSNFKSTWKVGTKVRVKIDGNYWKNGIIHSVKENCYVQGEHTPLALTITCIDEDTNQEFFARTWSDKCSEIPKKFIKKYVYGRDMRQEHFNNISVRESNMCRLLTRFAKHLSHKNKHQVTDPSNDVIEEQRVDIFSVIGKDDSVDDFLHSVSEMSEYNTCLAQAGAEDEYLNKFAFIIGCKAWKQWTQGRISIP